MIAKTWALMCLMHLLNPQKTLQYVKANSNSRYKVNQKSIDHKNMSKISNAAIDRWRGYLNQLTTRQLGGLVLLLAMVLQIPLILNPGYFSHDELQWAARADVTDFSLMPWLAWFDFEQYQFRPLTFNLWLWLSYFLFETPVLFHAVLVFWGSFNAVLLMYVARYYLSSPATGVVAGLLFVLSPYAIYVHGWVATMADLLVLSFLLLLILAIINHPKIISVVLATFLLTSLALFSKESALSIPAILAVVWMVDGRKSHWLLACMVSGLVAALYLGLRLPVLLQQPEGTHYSLSVWSMPIRWLEYNLYWIMPNAGEPNSTLPNGFHISPIIAMLFVIGFFMALWLSHRKLTLVLLFGSIATLLPVLPIASSAGQYGYLFAAWTVLMVALIWPHASSWVKKVIAVMAALGLMHAMVIMVMMYYVGAIQSVFTPAVAKVVAVTNHNQPIRLKLAADSRPWIFVRLVNDIPSYQGVAIGDRIQLVNQDQTADYLIQADGELMALNAD